MKNNKKSKSGDYKDYLLKSLKDKDEVVAYINAALDERDTPESLLLALKHVAEAYNMKELAEKSRLNRVTLYRILSKDGNPNLESLEAILNAMNLKLRVEKRAA